MCSLEKECLQGERTYNWKDDFTVKSDVTSFSYARRNLNPTYCIKMRKKGWMKPLNSETLSGVT